MTVKYLIKKLLKNFKNHSNFFFIKTKYFIYMPLFFNSRSSRKFSVTVDTD